MLVQAMVIFASVPMVTIYPLLGQRYGEEEFCAAALLVTTTLSFLSISAALFFIR
jgi:malonate transporter